MPIEKLCLNWKNSSWRWCFYIEFCFILELQGWKLGQNIGFKCNSIISKNRIRNQSEIMYDPLS